MSNMVFEVMQESATDAVIKVIGVGGGGCNAIDNMIDGKVNGVEFICANTDAQTLKRNRAPQKLQLGLSLTKGLGAGANPEVGRSAALEDRERIAEMLKGANMVFVTAGMGGGTGTGAAPVVAEVARELGILTVGVVTRPFEHEGRRIKVAQQGIEDLKKHVDSLIVIPNDKLMEVLGEDVTMREAFRAADDVLKGAVAGIAEVITCPGFINVDFADVRTVMGEMGLAMMGSSFASGLDRARIAAEQAVASPLLDNITLDGARGVLINISTAPGCLKMSEYKEIMAIVRQYADEDAQVKFGTAEVEDMPDDMIRVTLIATGLGQKKAQREERPEYIKIVKTGTDDYAYQQEEDPLASVGKRRTRTPTSSDFSNPEVSESYDIPAFLRRQAD
ncbi:cell division protein FtsZ [Crenobacter intestini]|uniref:Cell division protein FtsZ n=1 Tax=Crenobacter intestini TaxID=2563443 RepID=A0A4T0V358_9NEIS|nr:cell division protein FtsZ [Crenobacter intestini]TIC86080.1 cell division protein FtsZ [Crenobacter intestini]